MSFLSTLVVLCALVTAVILFSGVGSMLHDGPFDERHSEQFMFARVGAQAITLLFMLTAYIVANL